MLTITPQQLTAMQAEIQQFSDEYERWTTHCCGVRDRFIAQSKIVVEKNNKSVAIKHGQVTHASSSAPPLSEETARAAAWAVPIESVRATVRVVREESAPTVSVDEPVVTNSVPTVGVLD